MKTEVTVEVKEKLESALEKLLNQGFQIVEKFELHDWYFSTYNKKEVKSINYEDLMNASILLRSVVSDNPCNLLIFKKKDIDNNGNVIGEDKNEIEISDIKTAIEIFSNQGQYNWCHMINKSLVLKRGIMSFCLQIIAGLGIFIEYEEKIIHAALSDKNKFQALKDELKTLNLNLGEAFSCKKPYMILHK